MAILEVNHIEKHFGKTKVLKDVSFSMEEGSAIAIIGSSGSGKTTLLRCLNFLEKPNKGTIKVRDEILFDADNAATDKDADLRKKPAFWNGVSVVQFVPTVYSVTKCDIGRETSRTGTAGFQTEQERNSGKD